MASSALQMQFATPAIGATAQHMGISATELRNRLKRYGLVKRLLFDCSDTLHSESIEGVVWNVQEAGNCRCPDCRFGRRAAMSVRVHWRKEGRIASLIAARLNIDAERALDILYNSRTYKLLSNPDSGLQFQNDEYIFQRPCTRA